MSIAAKRLDGSRCHLERGIGLSPGRIVLDGDLAPQKGAQQLSSPNFSAHVYGQTVAHLSYC